MTTGTAADTTTADTAAILAPLAARSRAAYDADWLIYALWCDAADHQPLPAAPATVLEFLAEHPARPATQTRRVAAINRIHRERQHRPPGADPMVQTALAHLHPPVHQIRPVVAVLEQALLRIPVGGWPTGMFGRRDALLLTLRYRAGLTLSELVGLCSDDLHLDEDRKLHIHTAGRTVVLPPTDKPATCPTCIWRRWRIILTLADRHAANCTFKARLKDVDPIPTTHRCSTPPLGAGPRIALPVFMPIDRWGSMPGIPAPTTTRTATALTTGHLSDHPPVHPAVAGSEQAAEPPPELAPHPPAPPVDYTPTYQAGVAARQHAVTQLRHVAHELDDLDQAADLLNTRILELTRMFEL